MKKEDKNWNRSLTKPVKKKLQLGIYVEKVEYIVNVVFKIGSLLQYVNRIVKSSMVLECLSWNFQVQK